MTIEETSLNQGFRIGPWRVVPQSGELRRGSTTQRLEPKVMRLLVLLARRSPAVVGKEEITAVLWPETVVGEDALARCLLKLRRALDDDARNPRFIETLPRRGYRLLLPIDEIETTPGHSVTEPSVMKPRAAKSGTSESKRSRTRILAPGLVLAAVAVLVLALRAGPGSGPDAEPILLSRAHDHYYQFQQAENERAQLLYQRVLEDRPDEAEALAGMANTLVQRVIRWPEVGGPVPEASRSLSDALARRRVDTPWAQATLERASELARRAVAAETDSGFAWKANGLVAALRRDFTSARESYARALEVDAGNWEAAVNLGDLDLIEGNEAGAVDHFIRAYDIMEGRYPESAQRIGPWQPEIGVVIGQLYRSLGDDARAEAWFRRVLSSTPLHVDATLSLVALRAEAGDAQEAEALCRDLVRRIGPLDPCRPHLADP